MKRKTALALRFGTAALLFASTCQALYSVASRGTWPKSWPAELDGLRAQGRTLDHSQFSVHEIPFSDRAQFEAAWPHILKVKSKYAPLVLLSTPDRSLGESTPAGVRIRAPRTGAYVTATGANRATRADDAAMIGPPWPNDIRSETGALPE